MFINQVFQYVPRLFGVVTLLLFTWLTARLGKYVVIRSLNVSEIDGGEKRKTFNERVGTAVYFGVFFLMAPFMLRAAGLNAGWLFFSQSLISIAVQAWPLWFGLSLVLGGILFITRAAPKVIADLLAARKSSIG